MLTTLLRRAMLCAVLAVASAAAFSQTTPAKPQDGGSSVARSNAGAGPLPSTKPSACPNLYETWYAEVPANYVKLGDGNCYPRTTCPAGSSYVASTNTCAPVTCPSNQVWNGTACACPGKTVWNGSMCEAPPPPSCPGNQAWDGAACACPPATSWNGSTCLALPVGKPAAPASWVAGFGCEDNMWWTDNPDGTVTITWELSQFGRYIYRGYWAHILTYTYAWDGAQWVRVNADIKWKYSSQNTAWACK